MAIFNAEKLRDLLERSQWDEAKKLLGDYLNAPQTTEEKGAAYLAFVMTYLSVMSQVYEQYNQQLDEALHSLDLIDSKERELTSKVKAERIRLEIQK